MNTKLPKQSITSEQPVDDASVQNWIDWFHNSFLPGWIARARDPQGFGFYDLLNENAQPLQQDRRTVLAQARLLFTFSHLALLSHNTVFKSAATAANDSLHAFRKSPGAYCRARNGNKQPTGDANDNLATSYDQCFVILGLCTFGKLNPDEKIDQELEACWNYIESNLTDPATGLLLEHDRLTDPTLASAPNRAQNPHMHLYEAALQAYEMTCKEVWLERAIHMRSKGLEYFYDQSTGTLIEFIAPDLNQLADSDGQHREIGHQCEWAWLLYREAELGGDSSVIGIADRFLAFADTYGFAKNGVMQGAAFDAVSSDTSWREDKFLLWPQTEAIKTYAMRKDQAKAEQLTLLVFKKYFAGYPAFVNQLDESGNPIWNDALSRLLYHLVLALTEGARAGLWDNPD